MITRKDPHTVTFREHLETDSTLHLLLDPFGKIDVVRGGWVGCRVIRALFKIAVW